MSRLVVVSAGILLLLIVLWAGFADFEAQDSDIKVTPNGNELIISHFGEPLANVVLTINGQHQVEIGEVAAGEHHYSDERLSGNTRMTYYDGIPISTIELTASRQGRAIDVRTMFMMVEHRR